MKAQQLASDSFIRVDQCGGGLATIGRVTWVVWSGRLRALVVWVVLAAAGSSFS